MLAQVVTTILGFFLLVAILRRLFWNTVLRLLDERRQRIETGFQHLEQAKQETARLHAEYQQRLTTIEEEARSKIQQAVLEGKRIAVEIQEQARQQGHAIISKSKAAIELEVAKARVTLRDQVAAMTLEALERILRQKLDPTSDQQLVERILGELEERGART